jgi:hypothetical protein
VKHPAFLSSFELQNGRQQPTPENHKKQGQTTFILGNAMSRLLALPSQRMGT